MSGSKPSSASVAILVVCIVAVLATGAVSLFAFERLPHLEDEVAYLFQARTMALGRLTVPSPSQPEAFWTPFVLDHDGKRFGKYAPGWPAVLGLGVLPAGGKLAWLVNPFLAPLALYLVYRLGRTLYDTRTGLLAGALGLLSPLFLVLSGSFLSHVASLVWLLLFSLWFVWTAQGLSWWFAAGAGLAWGAAFLTRPLTAVAFALPMAVYAIAQVVRSRQAHWRRYLLVALCGTSMAALLPVYQWATTGDPWLNPYVLWWPYDRIGFGPGIGAMPGGHSPYYAWINLRQDMARSATDVFGWPTLSWLPVLLGLGFRPRRWRDWALLAPFSCLVIAYLFYWIGSPARLWGPRYYFEGFAGLWILGSAGLLKVWDWAADRQRWVRPMLAALLVLITAVNLTANVPSRMREAHGFYGITRDQLRPIEDAAIENALVIVYAERWLEYGAMLADMSPTRDDDIVYARGTNAEIDAAVIAQYPDRPVYYLSGGELTRVPPQP